MKKIILLLIGITYYNLTLSQEYIEILRAADNNILVNPALAGIDGRNSLTILDTGLLEVRDLILLFPTHLQVLG